MNTLLPELRQAARTLARTPLFTLAAVVALGIGIGAATAVFSVVNGVLLRALPFHEPERLVSVEEGIPKLVDRPVPFSPPDYLTLTQQTQWFAAAASYRNVSYEVSGLDQPERAVGLRATASLAPLLGMKPALGRWFTDDDDRNARPVVALSHAFWSRKFGADPGVIGRALRLDRAVYTVVGVLPAAAVFPPRGSGANREPADIFVPMSYTAEERQGYGQGYNNSVIARLQPGVTVEQAQASAGVLARRFEDPYPASIRSIPGFSLAVTIQPLRSQIVGNVERMLLVMLAAVAMLLLIGCADVANLMLTRAAGRAKEMAVRAALGASGGRLIRQALLESGLVALAGGAAGVATAAGALKLLLAAAPVSLPRAEAIALDGRVLAFALLASLATAAIFGLAPALEAARSSASEALREGGRGGTQGIRRRRWLSAFVVAEFALAVVLLAGAGLLLRSFDKLMKTDPGFRPRQALGFTLSLPAQQYPKAAAIRGFWERLRERLAALPGVESVGLGDLPFAVREGRAISPEDRSAFPGNPPGVRQAWVHGDYFRALGVDLKQGRYFTAADTAEAQHVVILNETMARTFYPGRNPLGQRLKWGGSPDSAAPWMTVVGVVADLKPDSLHEKAGPMTFTPYMQEEADSVDGARSMLRSLSAVVRTTGDPEAIANAVRREVAQLDPTLPVARLSKLDNAVSAATAPQRFNAFLLGAFALAALVLATLGIGGVVAYSAAQRTKEIGVRMALGASRGRVLGMVVGEGMLLAAIGIALGTAGALALTGLLRGLLYGVEPTDPATFAGVVAVLLAVAALASGIPAWRATRVDPLEALRYE